jgi:hypothetical protein
MLSLRRQICVEGRIFMGAQSLNTEIDQPNGSAKQKATIRGHRSALPIIGLLIVSIAVIAPYVATSSVNKAHNSEAGQPTAQSSSSSEPTPTTNQQQEGTMQRTSGDASNKSQTTVTVNGKAIEVPANGSYSKTTDDSSGHTEINVESSNSGNDSSSSNSSLQVNVHSESSSSTSD